MVLPVAAHTVAIAAGQPIGTRAAWVVSTDVASAPNPASYASGGTANIYARFSARLVSSTTGALYGDVLPYVDAIGVQQRGTPWYTVNEGSWEGISPGYGSGWTLSDASNRLQVRRTPSGQLHLRGTAVRVTPGANAIVFTLPPGFRPSKTSWALVWIDGVGASRLTVAPTGNVAVVGYPTVTTPEVNFDGASIWLD
jgi:hypothetical protein